MSPTELDIGGTVPTRRVTPRKAALDALERLLRAHAALSEQRDRESPYGLLRPARDDEIEMIEATFLHCGVPLPDTLRAIYRRSLGIGNPVSSLPVLAVPFLRARLPDEGYGLGGTTVGLDAFEEALGLHRDVEAFERPPFLHLGHAAPLGLTVSRNGLWSLADYQGRRDLPEPQDFALPFEAAFVTFVEQVLLLWANDLAGAPVRLHDLDVTRGARLGDRPRELRDALARLVVPRTLSPRNWGEVEALDSPALLRAAPRSADATNPARLHAVIAVVGLPYGDAPEVAARIAPGDLLRLRPVDDNPHDPDAVEVWRDGDPPIRVGFVERAAASHLRALPRAAEAWRLRVSERTDRVLAAVLERMPPEDEAAADSAEGTSLPHGDDLFSQEL